MPGQIHRGAVVTPGNLIPHQLLGVVSHLPSSPNLCEGGTGYNSPNSNRQRPVNVLHQLAGRNSFTIPIQAGQDSTVMVHGEEGRSPSRAHSRHGQHSSGQGIASDDRSLGLEVAPANIQQSQQTVWPIPNRPVCIQSFHTDEEVLQLEARSISRRDQCLSPDVARTNHPWALILREVLTHRATITLIERLYFYRKIGLEARSLLDVLGTIAKYFKGK